MAGCAASVRRGTRGLMYKLTGETFVTLANIRTVRHAFSPGLLIKIKGRSETVLLVTIFLGDRFEIKSKS
jgi:hypothetical protein